MIKLKPIHTGSSGNSFLISDNDTDWIMLDCGIKERQMKVWAKKSKFDISSISNILITHMHKDHCKGAKDLTAKTMCKFYGSKETLDSIDVDNYKKEIIEPSTFKVNNWDVLSFRTSHGSVSKMLQGSYGYVLRNELEETIVYLTDTGDANKDFKNANIYLIEANYHAKQLQYELDNDLVPAIKVERLVSSNGHLSVQQSVEYLNNNVGDDTKLIVFMHAHKGAEDMVMEYAKKHLKNKDIEIAVLKTGELLYDNFVINGK